MKLILLVIIVNQFICTSFSQNLERTFESRSGNFPILISGKSEIVRHVKNSISYFSDEPTIISI